MSSPASPHRLDAARQAQAGISRAGHCSARPASFFPQGDVLVRLAAMPPDGPPVIGARPLLQPPSTHGHGTRAAVVEHWPAASGAPPCWRTNAVRPQKSQDIDASGTHASTGYDNRFRV